MNNSGKNPESELFKKISERDTDSLSRLYDLHSKYLFTIIYYILRNKSESEDILQEVFLQIWDKIDSYDENLGSPVSWMTRITRNKAIDRLRSRDFKKRSDEVDIERFFDIEETSVSSNPENDANLSREKKEIVNALNGLNKSQRDLIEFAYFRGYSQTELAEHFKIPLGTVKTRMRSAMQLLREKLKHLL